MTSEDGLIDIRNKLDDIDNRLLNLLNERMELVHQVGIIKAQSGGAIYRPEREKSIIERLDNINKANKGLLTRSAIEALFLEIFAISRNLELPENIGYLGPKGSFTHQAAETRFGAMSSYISISSIKGIFKELEAKNIKFGVVPIENSSNGIVNDTINSFTHFNSKIVAEVILNIHHTLATTCDKIEDIKKIYSKDIAFDQCRRFLTNYGLDEIELIPVESTTKAAKLAVEEPNSAAICAHVAAKIYNLPILFENIEDKDNNKTRFFILSDFDNSPSGNDKTSLLAKFPDEQGILVKFLNDLNNAKINLTKIKSHIVEGDSIFFIDFDGHKDDENIKEVLEKHSENVKILGSYVKEIKDI
ncbi:chorismate mutase [Arcobacter porcinus]|uniref:Bifunctional chorismate mutase/prephenate dehydratase n=1 Tax=Arcobacter porcinus TaxID=1935204 RepID=A0A1C0AY42_9BACT|nr:chorismate mutase [Arcobacter porcinus]OCL94528.1 P-protein [Aliarcobacter thereius]OCL83127.1 P-protein [Arcobacter porcinus]OCL83381.1 P-protein [Arcobacter porcinus]OCL88154.1 P-protein [Arcobacter porcinus]OCL92561.1 P-protein [Arcobacter porcinus]